MTLRLGSTLNQFVLERVLSERPDAAVYAARDAASGAAVAVKVFAQGISSSVVLPRFARLKALSTPFIPAFADVGTTPDGNVFAVMELVEGETFAGLLRRGILHTELVDVALCVCVALSAMHGAGIFHRRLSSGRIHVRRMPHGGPRVKLGGLLPGRASSVPTADTWSAEAGVLFAPEVVSGESAGDAASDIWALGVVLYEALISVRPFDAASADAYLRETRTRTPVNPSSVRSGFPAELDAIVLRCLAAKPGDRFAGADELGIALAPYASLASTSIMGMFRRRAVLGGSEPPARPSGGSSAPAASEPPAAPPVIFDSGPDDEAAFHAVSRDGRIVGLKEQQVATVARAKRVEADARMLADRAPAVAPPDDGESEGGEIAAIPLGPPPSNAPAAPADADPRRALVWVVLAAAIVIGVLVGLLVKLLVVG